MTDLLARLRRFLRELKRRNVYKVAVTYAAVVFIGLQAVRLLVPATTLPGWADELLIAIAVLGFPIAIVLAWAFEMTPEGVRRTEAVEVEEAGGSSAYPWIGLAVVVLLAGGVWYATTGDGGEPAAETTTATDTAQITKASTDDRTASRDRPFVAVLPLENLSPDEENAFFADGIHEEILGQLSKVSGLGVFARTTMVEIANAGMTAAEIGRELDAQAVLEGSVRRAAGRVRITTQLIDPQSRDHLWSDTYERKLSPEQIFDIQADIAGEVSSALEAELTTSERTRIADAPTADLAAYDAYLKGRDLFWETFATREFGRMDRAVEHLREAVRRDSIFAEALGWLATVYAARYSLSARSRWRDSATVTMERARALGPNSSTVHATRGNVFFYFDSLEAAKPALQQALELQPSHTLAATFLSHTHRALGDRTEAVRWAYRAVQLDPRGQGAVVAMWATLWSSGMLEAAEAWIRRMIHSGVPAPRELAQIQLEQGELDQARALTDSVLESQYDRASMLGLAGEIALQTGDPEQAKAYLEQVPEARRRSFPEDSPSRPERITLNVSERMLLGEAELRLGNGTRGRELLTEAVDSLRAQLEQRKGGWQGPAAERARLAASLIALGQQEEGLTQLERAVDEGLPRPQWLRTYPLFSDLRSNSRFEKVVRRADANRQQFREEFVRMGIDLYPPGAEAGTTAQKAQADD